MKPQLLLIAILMVLLPSCCSIKLADANRIHFSSEKEIRDDAKAVGYLVSAKGGKETFRFRDLLYENGSSRIVEITVPQNHLRSGVANMREVDQPFLPGKQALHTIRVVQPMDARPFYSGRKSVDSREWVIGKLATNPRLYLAPKGRVYTDNSLHLDLKMVHRSKGEAVLRNLGYLGTAPCDLVTLPLFLAWYSGFIGW